MNFNNDLEDELLQRAFDVDEELPLPEDYVLDEINSKSVEFLKNVDKERKLLSSNNQNSIIVDYMDIEFSLNVDNTSNFKENYKRLKIPQRWIDGIKIEFSKIKNYFDSKHIKYIRQWKNNTCLSPKGYNLMFDFFFLASNRSNGALLGTNKIPLISRLPSITKWMLERCSSQSLVIDL